jgi:GntR family transcriptional repressor for pyruvate dehydrogenase complex
MLPNAQKTRRVDTAQDSDYTSSDMREAAGRPARETSDRSAQATERVVDHLRRLIDSGKLRPGDRLAPERELATQLGVSRPSVRTALRALAAMRVIESRHGSGTFIPAGPPILGTDSLRFLAALHHFDWASVFEARRILESSIAALAAERATGEDLATMAEHVAAMFSTIDDPLAFSGHDQSFHVAVAQACHNPILSLVAQKVAALALEQRRATPHRGTDLKVAAERHRQVYLAIRARDPERAHSAMAQHLAVASEATREEEGNRPAGALPVALPKKRATRPTLRTPRPSRSGKG